MKGSVFPLREVSILMSEMCAEDPCSSSGVPGLEMKRGASSPPWGSVTKAFLGQEASPSLFLAYEAKSRENFKI